jgi:hypothetical protein
MGIQGYGIFIRLLKEGHTPERMGLRGTVGDVTRWTARVRLARNFRGLEVEDYSEQTLRGYSAFFQVFLTHSALERYLPIVGLTDRDLKDALLPHKPEEPIRQFFALDRSGKLFDFLHARLKPKLQANLVACRDGICCDVACLSAAVRHIFAHGHLAANAHDINPNQVSRACKVISDFLLDYMEYDFTKKIGEYYRTVASTREGQAERGSVQAEPSATAARPPEVRPGPRTIRCSRRWAEEEEKHHE